MQAEHGEISAAAKDAEATRANEARAALAQLNDTHQAELTSVKRQILGLEDRCSALANEKVELNRQLSEARKQYEADLRAAQTAAAAAESAAAAGSAATAAAPAPPPLLSSDSATAASAPPPTASASVGTVETTTKHVSVSAAAAAADVGSAPRRGPERSRAAAPVVAGGPPGATMSASAPQQPVAAAAAVYNNSAAAPPMPEAAGAGSTAANGVTGVPGMGLAPIDVPRSAHREVAAGPPPMIDVPHTGGLVVDWNDPDNVSIARQACHLFPCRTAV